MIASFLSSIIGFLLLMGVLVTAHEFGHFWVAKKLGFKVLTFSIGFGKQLWSRKGKDGVVYRIGLIPLGGYVAMLDERAHDVPDAQKHLTFNAQPVWKRALVIAAGPFVNLLLAVTLLFGLYLYGMPAFKAKLDTPLPQSTLAQAGFQRGDEVVTIEGQSIKTFEEMMMGFVEYLNDGQANVEVLRNGRIVPLVIEMENPLRLRAGEYIDEQLGIALFMPQIPPIIDKITPDGIAARGKLQTGDRIVLIDDTAIGTWQDLLQFMAELNRLNSNEVTLNFTIERNNELIELPIVTQRGEDGRFLLGVGVSELTPEMIAELESIKTVQKYSVVNAFKYAVTDAYRNSLLIFKFIGRMFTGEVHPNVMAGPVTIADVAGKKLDAGWIYFIQLMAIFSVNLGILNLLPIPVLDGGRLVGLGVEAVIGKNKISPRISLLVMQIGGFFLFTFMAFVIFYDVIKWF